jgi:acylphosphatase
MNIRGTFTVIGAVQGVRYRETVLVLANEQGLVGFVRNRKNGDVKVVVEGDESLVLAFHRRLDIRSGRILVDKVISNYSDEKGRFTRFRIVRGKNISDGELEIMERLDSGLVLTESIDRKQDTTREDIRAMDSHITGMDRNIGGHFDKLDAKYDSFGASLAQVADDIHDMKDDIHAVKGDISGMKCDIHDMKGDMNVVKGDIHDVVAGRKAQGAWRKA